jgi:hypothetical protein
MMLSQESKKSEWLRHQGTGSGTMGIQQEGFVT